MVMGSASVSSDGESARCKGMKSSGERWCGHFQRYVAEKKGRFLTTSCPRKLSKTVQDFIVPVTN